MLEERPIILIMEEVSESSLIIQGLISLLYPLEWSFTIVPIVTPELSNIVSAPMGCILGVQNDVWDTHCLPNYSEISDLAVVCYMD